MDKWHRWGHYGCKNISKDAEDDDVFVRLKDVEGLVDIAKPGSDKTVITAIDSNGKLRHKEVTKEDAELLGLEKTSVAGTSNPYLDPAIFFDPDSEYWRDRDKK